MTEPNITLKWFEIIQKAFLVTTLFELFENRILCILNNSARNKLIIEKTDFVPYNFFHIVEFFASMISQNFG